MWVSGSTAPPFLNLAIDAGVVSFTLLPLFTPMGRTQAHGTHWMGG
jgi:hypothetical protein